MNRTDFIRQLKRHEGFRDRVYMDSTGNLTAGWGHAFLEGSKVPINVCEALFQYDLIIAIGEYAALNLPIDSQDTVRKYAFINMVFNLGIVKFKGFTKMLAAARHGDWSTAADEMLDSRWARQVGSRAIELAAMVRTGKL